MRKRLDRFFESSIQFITHHYFAAIILLVFLLMWPGIFIFKGQSEKLLLRLATKYYTGDNKLVYCGYTVFDPSEPVLRDYMCLPLAGGCPDYSKCRVEGRTASDVGVGEFKVVRDAYIFEPKGARDWMKLRLFPKIADKIGNGDLKKSFNDSFVAAMRFFAGEISIKPTFEHLKQPETISRNDYDTLINILSSLTQANMLYEEFGRKNNEFWLAFEKFQEHYIAHITALASKRKSCNKEKKCIDQLEAEYATKLEVLFTDYAQVRDKLRKEAENLLTEGQRYY